MHAFTCSSLHSEPTFPRTYSGSKAKSILAQDALSDKFFACIDKSEANMQKMCADIKLNITENRVAKDTLRKSRLAAQHAHACAQRVLQAQSNLQKDRKLKLRALEKWSVAHERDPSSEITLAFKEAYEEAKRAVVTAEAAYQCAIEVNEQAQATLAAREAESDNPNTAGWTVVPE
jgi:hypothetical protein